MANDENTETSIENAEAPVSETVDETVEAKTVETVIEKQAPQLALAARKMKQAREAEERATARLKEAEAFEQKLAGIRQDPLGFLKQAGLDWDKDVIPRVLQLKEAPPEETDPVVVTKKLISDFEKKQEAARAAAFQQQVDAAKVKIAEIVAEKVLDDNDKFELLNAQYEPREVFTEVMRLMEGWYQETGKPISAEQAAEMLEAELDEQANKLVSTKKIKNKLVPRDEEDTSDKLVASKGAIPAKKASKTLTNSLSGKAPSKTERIETPEERFQRAKRALQGRA